MKYAESPISPLPKVEKQKRAPRAKPKRMGLAAFMEAFKRALKSKHVTHARIERADLCPDRFIRARYKGEETCPVSLVASVRAGRFYEEDDFPSAAGRLKMAEGTAIRIVHAADYVEDGKIRRQLEKIVKDHYGK